MLTVPRIDNGFFRVSSDGPVALQLGIFDVSFYTSNTIAPSLGEQPTLSTVWIASRRARDRTDVTRPCCRPGLAELGTTRNTRVCVSSQNLFVSAADSRHGQRTVDSTGVYLDCGSIFGRTWVLLLE